MKRPRDGRWFPLSRRAFLSGAAALPFVGIQPTVWGADTGPSLIVREKEPQNLEFPFATLREFITPNELFYIRNHFTQPKLDVNSWRLLVVGAVERPLDLTYEEVRKLPAETLPVTLECAGNGRAFLEPKASGVQWERGAVGTAKWSGVPLATILKKAGLKKTAVEVVLEGSDRGELKKEPRPVGRHPFARSLPLEKALKPEVLLAHQMNGETLPAAHGYPLRAIVAGWYGMASVKWLARIVVTDRPFHGYDQTTDYAIWETHDGLPSLTPIGGIDVKATIARPSPGEEVAAGKDYQIVGAAWAGEATVAKVEVSVDGGKTWTNAQFLSKEAMPFCWRLWRHSWKPTEGKRIVMARATDSKGRTQPLKRDPDRRAYMITHVQAVEVVVK